MITLNRYDFVNRSRIEASCASHGSIRVYCDLGEDPPTQVQRFVALHEHCGESSSAVAS